MQEKVVHLSYNENRSCGEKEDGELLQHGSRNERDEQEGLQFSMK